MQHLMLGWRSSLDKPPAIQHSDHQQLIHQATLQIGRDMVQNCLKWLLIGPIGLLHPNSLITCWRKATIQTFTDIFSGFWKWIEQDAHAKGSTFSSCYSSAIPIAPGLTHYSPFHSFVFENSPCSDMYESISKRWHFTLPIRQTLNKKSERVSSSSKKVSEYKHLYEKIKSLLSLSSLSSWLLWEYSVVVVDGCLVVSVWFLCVWQSGCMCVHVHRWFHHMLRKKVVDL